MTTTAATDLEDDLGPATVSFGQAVMSIMRARNLGVRRLARAAKVSPGYLSRVIREADGKHASPDLIRRVGVALELPEGFFIETRRQRIVALLEERPELVEEVSGAIAAAAADATTAVARTEATRKGAEAGASPVTRPIAARRATC